MAAIFETLTMAYQDTNCPCGGRKIRETMLCQTCVTTLAGKPEMAFMHDSSLTWEQRRSSAIRLIAMARKRTFIH